MDFSLRSHLAAGIAVAGAAAIAAIPTIHPESLPSLQRVSADFELAAAQSWANPITELGNTLGLLGGDLFATNVVEFTAVPVEGGDEIRVFTNLGLIPQLLNGSIAGQFYVGGLPLLQAVGTNLSGYIEYGVQALQSLTSAVGGVTFGIPLTAFEVLNGIVTGNPVNIAESIQTNIITPVTDAFANIVDLSSNVLNDVIANATTLITALPTVVVGVAQTVIGGITVVGTQLVNVLTETLGSITNPQEAWNTLVNGLVSPNGVLGSLVNLSVGTGVMTLTGPVPSLRQTLTAATVGVALELTNDPVPPAAAVRSAAANAPRAAAALSTSDVKAAAGADAPSIRATAAIGGGSDKGGTQAGSSDNASAPTAVKQRGSRTAAPDKQRVSRQAASE